MTADENLRPIGWGHAVEVERRTCPPAEVLEEQWLAGGEGQCVERTAFRSGSGLREEVTSDIDDVVRNRDSAAREPHRQLPYRPPRASAELVDPGNSAASHHHDDGLVRRSAPGPPSRRG